jgi:serine protease Do
MELEPKDPGNKALPVIILISIMAGVIGGVLGMVGAVKWGNFQRYLTSATTPTIQQGIYKEDSAVIDVVKKASPAVVSIVISRDLSKIPGFGLSPFDPFFSGPNVQQIGAGSGFFVTPDGLIVTNRHVVADEGASYSVVTNDGISYDAQVLARDPVNDLAIIKINIKDAPVLPLADSSEIQVGQQAVAIGNSLGQYQNTVTSGIVSGIGRSIVAGGGGSSEQLDDVLQTDAAINPGNSGGPLLNLAGQVIGINTAVDQQGQLVGFAIPSNDAKRAVESYQKLGRITRPFLGVRYVVVTKALAEQQKLERDYGALIVSGQGVGALAVLPDSPAAKAGLVEDDIILEIDGIRVTPENTIVRQLKSRNVGDSISLKVFHKGSEKMVSLVLGEAP